METTNYKVGDKVVIRKHLRTKREYGTNNCVRAMINLGGKQATITRVNLQHRRGCDPFIEYSIDLDFGKWYWTEQMFEKGDK